MKTPKDKKAIKVDEKATIKEVRFDMDYFISRLIAQLVSTLFI